MKQILHTLAVLAIVALPFSLSSCDHHDPWYDGGGDNWHDGGYTPGGGGDDGDNTAYEMAQTLMGSWSGDVNLYEEQTNGSYQRYNFFANMIFYQNGGTSSSSLSGAGQETDYAYNEDGTLNYDDTNRYQFTWSINQNTGDITITYTGSGTQYILDYDAKERGFQLSNSAFSGYMTGVGHNDWMMFNFSRNITNKAKSASSKTTATSTKTFGTLDTVPTLEKTKTALPQRR